MIRVLIADDQTLMRDGLKTILELEADIEVAGTAADGGEACALCDEFAPDVVLMDIRMPGMGGVEATAHIRHSHPRTAVLVLTTFDDDAFIVQALRNGAVGYLLKDIEADRADTGGLHGRSGLHPVWRTACALAKTPPTRLRS